LFINGTQPKTIDKIHVAAKVIKDPTSGKYVLASKFSPPELVETRVFIRRDYKPKVTLGDAAYVLPTAVDTFSKKIIVPPVTPPIVEPPVVEPPVVDPPIVEPPVVEPTVIDPPPDNPGKKKKDTTTTTTP
ncbi:MAG: hypothetical protein MUO60_00940, partial [Clostridiaceae bacterium]|nr:hypothetical protein [Clostridiaceae bacterium]